MIYKLKGDCTNPIMEEGFNNIIIHIVNDEKLWGSGFVMAISTKWKGPENKYRNWNDGFKQGACQLVPVDKDLYVANLVAQSGVGSFFGLAPVRYGALEESLLRLKHMYIPKLIHKKTVLHMPELGCGRGGGSLDVVESILNKVFPDTKMYMYSYEGEFK
jgi:hypothetical protein